MSFKPEYHLITPIKNYASLQLAKTKDNMHMFVNLQDEYISRCILANGEWEPHIRHIFGMLVKPGDVVLDIGANIGTHTLFLSKLTGETGKLIAFEPCKINHDILVINCTLNRCSNVEVLKYGVGEKPGTMFIESKWNKTDQVQNYGCVVLQTSSTSEADECIHIMNLDSMHLPRVNVVKIDAENMEDQVLLGMKETIERCKPLIVVEIHDTDMHKVKPIIDSLNYELIFVGGIDFLAKPKGIPLKAPELKQGVDYFIGEGN